MLYVFLGDTLCDDCDSRPLDLSELLCSDLYIRLAVQAAATGLP